MKRLGLLLRLLVAGFLAGSALSSIPFIEFLRNEGQELLALAQEREMRITGSRIRRLQWTAHLIGDRDELDLDLSWGSLADSWKGNPALDDERLIEQRLESGGQSVRWVSDRFSLLVSQVNPSAGADSPRGFIQDLRGGQHTAMTYSERLQAYVSSAEYRELPLGRALAMLRSSEGERWEMVVFGYLDLTTQTLKQGLISWQLPVIAVIPAPGMPFFAWVWVAALAAASLCLFAPKQSARLLGLLRRGH